MCILYMLKVHSNSENEYIYASGITMKTNNNAEIIPHIYLSNLHSLHFIESSAVTGKILNAFL